MKLNKYYITTVLTKLTGMKLDLNKFKPNKYFIAKHLALF